MLRSVWNFFTSDPNVKHEDRRETHARELEPPEKKSIDSIQEKTVKESNVSCPSHHLTTAAHSVNVAEDVSKANIKKQTRWSLGGINIHLKQYDKQEEDNKCGAGGQKSEQFEDKDKIKQQLKLLFRRLNLSPVQLKPQDFLQVTSPSMQRHEPCEEENLVHTFIQRLLMMDYRARYLPIKERKHKVNTRRKTGSGAWEGDAFENIFRRSAPVEEVNKQHSLHPMDIQMAALLHSDPFLRQLMVTKLSQCQYALPLLVPSPFNQKIEFPLWTFRQIRKSWKSYEKNIGRNQGIHEAETPMVAFFRFSAISTSKSQIINTLINERHDTFFHRHCRGSSKSCVLMDGVVEIAWYCPSGEKTDKFTDCIAFCNLHGDAQAYETQIKILSEESSINVVLLPDLDKSDKSMTIVEQLYNNPKPLICLLTEDECVLTEMQKDKYKIGLKDRNKSDVSEELRRTINKCLSNTTSNFKLSDLVKHSGIKIDETDRCCKKGHEMAKQITALLENSELSKIKETFLPCQGKLWHEWCLKNKELYRPQGNNIEMHSSQKQMEMCKIREQQRERGLSTFMKLFIEKLDSANANEKMYFLKWLGFFLDEYTLEDLSTLHLKYDDKWSKVLHLKKKHDKSEQLKVEQTQLEEMSEEINAATFGLEHLLREIGQIYESHESGKKNKETTGCQFNVSSLPRLAAELMVSGYPMELMDGDAAHVPLIWVKAVLDELIKILGDKRVFVLSVLGIQSTGKSTLLNAMFGLQFAVSAGRCTRGAFMQLVKVSEELKNHFKFEYLLIVDTEGLRALELAGRSTRHHDNEMATFVVGLGNMTLINIFGENPAEMQDILQIVVQAFLRMIKVLLNPSCMFVHQNVGDITAGEKNMVGKRRLQEKLDEMTQLAAKEEVCDAECFSDVIKFDIKTDVRYFAQLWEGSPPMAPPNPRYSENVQELKDSILSHASKCNGVTLTQFRDRVGDLWNALLNENFVFSFKNTLEIVVYRKLEEEYAKWTWSLRSSMLEIEDKLHNRINNRQMHKVESRDLEQEMAKVNEEVKESMKVYFEEHKEKEVLIQWRMKFQEKIEHLHGDLVRDAKRKLDNISHQREALSKLDGQKTLHERKLLDKSKELGFSLKQKHLDENEMKIEFDHLWVKWVSELAGDIRPLEEVNIVNDIFTILGEIHEVALVHERLSKFESINQMTDFTIYVNPIKIFGIRSTQPFVLPPEEQESVKNLVQSIVRGTENQVKSKSVAKMGYNKSYIQEIAHFVKTNVGKHKCLHTQYEFKKEFTVDLTLFMCKLAGERFAQLHQVFREANDPLMYLEKKKPEYFSVFQGFCRGATSAAVFGALICNELKEPILQSVYNKTAKDLAGEMRTNIPAFTGNRSNLEKHILKKLAEDEDFDSFMEYILYPRDHFEEFIKAEVQAYVTRPNSSALTMIKVNIRHKENSIIIAAETATAEVLSKRWDANMWLDVFSCCLKDELQYNKEHLTGNCCQDITDFELLNEIVKKELRPITEELNKGLTNPSDIKMTMFRKPPDEILIEHFCQCCWVICPFCKVVCVNTMEDHPGDHIAPFHRNCGMNGMIYRGTNNLSLSFCTSAVASDRSFYPSCNPDRRVLWKEYRTASPKYSSWCITPDLSELPYWKWFVCQFQDDLESHYSRTFKGSGTIPNNWRYFTKEDALESLNKYI
ncbi:interferon-induced very large GTPase 1-like [Triplophysa rosa]|uniref:Interferon-induced very large GTPase 1-like n=1 Tax=Triplophysa rosa TaxID=992332 RepID=A0A9W7TVF4_TRIRA|nr:interferon-induced very large GTPase 1-like [Triplophysa rosa]XP_057202548.1 interferon-induced very large GTPase 1-like [Triplophysa rosa]XP_057202549.1 interferon-induced very large GTPase 1-like [Triplophysa rosa]XP_057202550.1 interferon-induced very large GTPase 1-like [Triplophysa rosa]KAI7803774.1 putative interferon-induced very large GTPase 1-like [Triplophysa rosa]